ISAISAAIALEDRFMIEGQEVPPIRVCLERNAQCFKGSIQLSGRKKPLRHLTGTSEELILVNKSANTGRLLLAGSDKQFVLGSVADICGIPGIPEWAGWFEGELNTHHAIAPMLGIGCNPVIVKGEKEQFLNWLSWGVESDAIQFPGQPGPICWPGLSLKDIFFQSARKPSS